MNEFRMRTISVESDESDPSCIGPVQNLNPSFPASCSTVSAKEDARYI